MKTQRIYSPNHSRRPNSTTSLNCWDLGMLMWADRAKDSCDSRGSAEDIWVRLDHLLHIHLILFFFLWLHTLYRSSLYLGDKNRMTFHLHLHEAEILFSRVPWIYSFSVNSIWPRGLFQNCYMHQCTFMFAKDQLSFSFIFSLTVSLRKNMIDIAQPKESTHHTLYHHKRIYRFHMSISYRF